MSRKVARELGLKILYQLDFEVENKDEQIEIFLNTIKEDKIHDDKPIKDINETDLEYIKSISEGTVGNLNTIDNKISELSVDWPISRIAKVDLAILRLALYEILYRDDIPNEVSINEAVELAKKYSTPDSGSFINGILGKVVR